MSDGTLIIDTALDTDGLKEDLSKLDKNTQKAITSMAESISSSVAEELVDSMLKTLGDGVLEALEESLSPEDAEALGRKLGDIAAQAYIEGWTQEDFNALGQNLIKDVEGGAKELALRAGEVVGEDVAEGFGNEVGEDTGEKAGKKVQDGLEDELDKDAGKKLGKETGKGIGEGVAEGAKPGINSIGDLIKGILTADAIKSLAKSAFNAIKDFVTDGIDLASDLQEVQNVVDVTFGESAGSINDWAKSARTSYGMSELAAKKYNGTMGAMFKSMGKTEKEAAEMSQTMVGLAGDMASFYNLEHDEAFNKIRSGISGETEPLKQLGINMSVANLEAYALAQGMGKTYQSMTQAEQATLRYNYLLSATADAQGDFARNGDSYANQIKLWETNISELKTTIGQALLPVLTDAVSWLNSLFGGTRKNGLSADVQGAIDSLDGIKTNVTNLRNEYAQTTIKINTDKEEAQAFLDELAALQAKPELETEDIARIKEISEALKGLYPELAKYVGSDGIIHKEAEEVRSLINGYAALNQQQAYMKLAEGLQEQYAEGLLNLDLLKNEEGYYYKQLVAIQERNKALAESRSMLEGLYTTVTTFSETGLAVSSSQFTAGIDQQTEALKSLYEVTDSFGDLDLSGIDWHLLFDEQGALQSAEYFKQNADAAQALYQVLTSGQSQINNLIKDGSRDAEATSSNLIAAREQIAESEPEVERIGVQATVAAEGAERLAGAVLEGGEATQSLGNASYETELAIARQAASFEELDEMVWSGQISLQAYLERTRELRTDQAALANMLSLTEDQMSGLNTTYGLAEEELRKLSAAGISYEQIVKAAEIGATSTDAIVGAVVGRTEEDIQRLTAAGLSYQAIIDDMETGGAKIEQVLAASDEEAAKVVAKTITIEEMLSRIEEAKTAGSEAEAALETAKTNMGEDAAAILEQMRGVITTIGTDIDTLAQSVPEIVKKGEEGAATAGKDLAAKLGEGWNSDTTFIDGVKAEVTDALAELENSLASFKSKGSDMIGAVAQGVTANSNVLSQAMQTAVQNAIAAAQSASIASYGNRFGYPHRAGLEYVPYDQYPATLHKGEAVLTAAEAALWRGGMYVQEPQTRGPQLDYDVMARAIWANAPEGGDIAIIMDSEPVGRLTESTISAIQGRRAKR